MEFMFWECFSYNKKGPCHVWKDETAAEKKECTDNIAAINKVLEPEARLAWKLETVIQQMGLCNPPGKKPVWKFTAKTGENYHSREE